MDHEYTILLAIQEDLLKDGFRTKVLNSDVIAIFARSSKGKYILTYQEYGIVFIENRICLYELGKQLLCVDLNNPNSISIIIEHMKKVINNRSGRVQKLDPDLLP